MRGQLGRVVWILLVCGSLTAPSGLMAIEKHWHAHTAETIIVGTLRPRPVWPWLDGWHMNGVITVQAVLYGGRLPPLLKFQLVCRWDWHCQRWPPPQYPEMHVQKGIWFLRHVDGSTYESSISPLFGFAPLSERAYWENYIRKHKRR